MLSTPRYSIITPTYQREDKLRVQYRGISEQTERDFEWLIVDDSPEPSTYFGTITDNRVQYLHVAHRMSLGAKRNLLVQQARGEIVVHFDDDDYYSKDYLATTAEYFDASVDFVKLSGWYVYSQLYRELGYCDVTQTYGLHLCWSKAPMRCVVFGDAEQEDRRNAMIGFGFSYAYRRDVWKKAKFPDRDFAEDTGFIEAVLAGGGRLHQFADTAGICVHVLHKTSMSYCFPQYRLPPFMIDRLLLPDWAAGLLNDPAGLDIERGKTEPKSKRLNRLTHALLPRLKLMKRKFDLWT
jgi:glycosyltransferase involved in cell wall biosynthesis